jgi:ankyrin repeat protein
MKHRTECAAALLDAGATISARDAEYASTPLAWAARNNLGDMVEFLLARGASPSRKSRESRKDVARTGRVARIERPRSFGWAGQNVEYKEN